MDKKLPSNYDLWLFDSTSTKKTDKANFFEKIKKTLHISTLKDLAAFYGNFRKPKTMPNGCEVYLFKEGIKPLWEDKSNQNGGSFFLHIKKTFANKIWENFLTSIVSEELEELKKVNGIIMRVLLLEVVFYIWTKDLTKAEERVMIQWVKNTAGLSAKIKLEFKRHPKPNKEHETPEKPSVVNGETKEKIDKKKESGKEKDGGGEEEQKEIKTWKEGEPKPFGQFDDD